MTRTEREMAAGAANSAKFAVRPQQPRRLEPWDQWNTPVFRPADGAGTQDRNKETIGKARNLFSRIR